MKKFIYATAVGFLLCFLATPLNLRAQSDLYEQGTVWELTFVKLKANMGDDYLKGLSKTWKSSMDMLVKENLIKSYKILMGSAANKSDFDLLLMVEHENLASFDPDPARDKKIMDLEKKIMDGMGDEYKKTIVNYETLREITGNKMMREIFLK
ncbi:MAG: hypothetical protein H6541_01600 [Lentimicrobiaceae bacterium]|nr:hypothetical protein [Lentimicrobiaceae bacterium]MCB9023104.1 hypothetical protein [Lentimicrobiaceae bacterium]MCO5264629.1 hypothetical protein [Lentimicrobium sp.]